MYAAETSLAAAERLGSIKRACQQKDARIYCQRAQDALLAVASIDEMRETAPRRDYPEVAPSRALPEAAPRRERVTSVTVRVPFQEIRASVPAKNEEGWHD
jgi:hypothetical protein